MSSVHSSVQPNTIVASEPLTGVAAIGLLCFGGAMVLTSLHAADFWPFPTSILGLLLLNCASGQILTGLAVWRRQQPLPALLLLTFGLFWFSRLAFDILPNAGFGTRLSPPAACGTLLLWGLFALILSNADDCPRPLRFALYGVCASLLLQAVGTLFFGAMLLPLSGSVGLISALPLGIIGLLRVRTGEAKQS